MVNVSFAVWDKAGTLLYGPVANNTLWQGFGGPCQTPAAEKLAARAQLLAEGWDRPSDAKDPVDIDDDVPDDSLVDHTGDRFDD